MFLINTPQMVHTFVLNFQSKNILVRFKDNTVLDPSYITLTLSLSVLDLKSLGSTKGDLKIFLDWWMLSVCDSFLTRNRM